MTRLLTCCCNCLRCRSSRYWGTRMTGQSWGLTRANLADGCKGKVVTLDTKQTLSHSHTIYHLYICVCTCIFGFIVLISSQLLSCISPTSYFAYGYSMHMLFNAPQRSHQNFGLADIAISCVYASRAGVGRKWSALVWKRAQFIWVFVLHPQRFGAIWVSWWRGGNRRQQSFETWNLKQWHAD